MLFTMRCLHHHQRVNLPSSHKSLFYPRFSRNIQEKYRLRRQWQISREPVTKNRGNRLQSWIGIELKEWRNDSWGMRIPNPNPPLQFPGGLACLDSEKAEALADNLEYQFQPIPVSPMKMDNVERVKSPRRRLLLHQGSNLF